MIKNTEKVKLWGKIFNIDNFALNSEKVELRQNLIFWSVVLISVLAKIFLVPYNMIDSGDNATSVWNAYWWAQRPFFVLPESGHPLWFYFIGLLIKITGEFYYTSIISMIFLMTISGIYIFKSALLFTDFKTSIMAFAIFTLNPIIFRLNFSRVPSSYPLASACIMIYFLLKAFFSSKSSSYFLVAGIFGFTALASRPEVLFLMIPLAIYIIFCRKKGAWYFAFIPLSFQLFWTILSYSFYGSPFKTFELMMPLLILTLIYKV
jgi:hypothetical protein